MPRSPLLVRKAVSFQKPYKLMWSLRAALSFHGLMTLSRRSIRPPPRGALAVWPRHSAACSVRTLPGCEETLDRCSLPNGQRQSRRQDSDAREDEIEEIEGSHCADADEVEQRAFHAQVGERLVQALEDSICAMCLRCFVRHKAFL